MNKQLNTEAVKEALEARGMTQKDLAHSLGVSAQSVTNWLSGESYPRPPKLLKLAAVLQLDYLALVRTDLGCEPIVAFRKKGSAKTTEKHIRKAKELGHLLKLLAQYLPKQKTLRTVISSPSTDYRKLQDAVTQAREGLGLGEQARLGYTDLIGEFEMCGAVLVPVLWGEKNTHENAIHIRLPKEDVTFIFLNLDTHIEDFKFWMAHELAHVYTPDIASTNFGEDFADAFAGALLFPKACAEVVYHQTLRSKSDIGVLNKLIRVANQFQISLNTVYQQIQRFCRDEGLPELTIPEESIHAARNSRAGPMVSNIIFSPMPPTPECYITSTKKTFGSDFFIALKRMFHERDTNPAYLQQLLDTSISDARAIHQELIH